MKTAKGHQALSGPQYLREQVIRLMNQWGRSLTFIRSPSLVYDSTTGIAAPATDDLEFEGVGRFGTYADNLVDGSRIRSGDRKVTFVPDDLSYRPLVGDVIVDVIDGTNYKVVNFQIREANGELVCCTLQVRGAGAGELV